VNTFEFSTDLKLARGFYDLVEANLCFVDDLKSEGARVRLHIRLDLFEMRDHFLGCVYYKVGERIAGLYCLTEKDDQGFVDSGYVAHKFRRQSIGFKLLQQACDKLIEMGKVPVCCLVRSAAMDRLIDKLPYPAGTIRKVDVDYDDKLDGLEDLLFTEDEQPPRSANSNSTK
jgi:GNAT superfamily N-acetyltransferase